MSKKLEKSDSYSDAFNRLIDVCDKQGTSVTSLLDKFTTSRSAITAWKKGNINTDVLAKIAIELDVSLDYLLNGKEKNSSAEELTADEQELIKYYRQLDDKSQGVLLGRAETMAESQQKITEKPTKNAPYITTSLVYSRSKDNMPPRTVTGDFSDILNAPDATDEY